MAEKRLFRFTGRYGEEVRNAEEIKDSSSNTPKEIILIKGTGMDSTGQERLVFFEVSRITNKKNGKYYISSDDSLPITYHSILLGCEYKDDQLNGKEYVYGNGNLIINTWENGKRIKTTDTQKKFKRAMVQALKRREKE